MEVARAQQITPSVLRRGTPALLGIGLVVPSIVWVALDRSVWPWDPSWYGQVSIDLWSTLRLDRWQWPESMAQAFGAKPPAIAWLGQAFVPVGDLVGGTQMGLLLSVVACQAVALGLLYVACRRLGAVPLAALAGTLVVAASPLFTSLSHEYFVEPIQTVAVTWAVFILASARRWPLLLLLSQAAAAAALGVLAKVSSPVYIALPLAGAALLWYMGRRERATARSLTAAGVGSIVLATPLVLGAVAWYAVNLDTALDHARLASSNTGLYGVDQGFVRELPEWVERFVQGAFLPHVWLVVLLLAAAGLALAAARGARPSLEDRAVVAAIACSGTLLLVIALFASQPNQESRYLFPLVPFLGVLGALALSASRSRALAAATVAVLAGQFALTTTQSFGPTPIDSLVSARIREPVRDGRFRSSLLGVVDSTCVPETANRISMIGAEHPWLNHNSMTMLAFERYARSGRKCYYTSLGYAESSVDAAWQRVVEFDPPFFVAIDYANPSNPLPPSLRQDVARADAFNRVNRAVLARVRSSAGFELLPGSERGGLVVYRRRDGAL